MLKLKQKPIEVELKPIIKAGEDGKENEYGEPFGFSLLLCPMKTPALISLQAQLSAATETSRNEEAYRALSQILGKVLEGWNGLTKEKIEDLTSGQIEDVPEGHSINSSSIRVSKENRAEIVDVIMLIAEHNMQFYGALSSKILEMSIQKKKEVDQEKKIL